MITDEEYKKWKPLIEEYEEAEFQQAQLEAMYCTECQAMEEHDCWCKEYEDSEICNTCGREDGRHYIGCPYDCNPYQNLIANGYD